jgi:hypothetical protein
MTTLEDAKQKFSDLDRRITAIELLLSKIVKMEKTPTGVFRTTVLCDEFIVTGE